MLYIFPFTHPIAHLVFEGVGGLIAIGVALSITQLFILHLKLSMYAKRGDFYLCSLFEKDDV